MPQAPTIRLDSPRHLAWRRRLGSPQAILRCDGPHGAALTNPAGEPLQRFADPLSALAWMEADAHAAARPTRWVGYLSYDLGRLFEGIPQRAADSPPLPWFVFTRHAASFADADASAEAIPAPAITREASASPVASPTCVPVASTATGLQSNFTRAAYLAAVQRAIDYIGAGDIFQVNLSQRFGLPITESAPSLYARIQARFPADYAALLDYGDHALVCNSPELFLAVSPAAGRRRVVTRPIKGTRPRAAGMDAQLLHSHKDQAELNMIVDLERNDLGRVCTIGSVRVTQPRIIETHATVYHGAATVEGLLRPGVKLVDLLAATFPGGSITGAPKIRAMEIIEELEPTRRGPYCGAVGYLDSDGSLEFNIAIRTLILAGGRVEVPVGGGIVADSTPLAEYEETIVKARAALAVLGVENDVALLR